MTQQLSRTEAPSPLTHTPPYDVLPEPMLWVTRVARIQKACVALHFSCAMDDRSVAAALGLRVETVAVLTKAALLDLGSPTRDVVELVPARTHPPTSEPAPLPWPAAPPERPVGWYRHPTNPRAHQFWDGASWTPWVPHPATGTLH